MKRTFTAALSWVLAFTLMLSVGGAAFADTLTLPSSLSVLGEEAFCGDTSLDEVVVPGGVTEIGSRAFADSSLQRIYLPATVGNIAGDAFAGADAEIIRTISPGESSVEIVNGGDTVRLYFIPGGAISCTRSYTLTSLGNTDTYGELYDASGNQLDYDDDGGQGNNFSITYMLASGALYYYEVRFYYSDVTGAIPLSLSASDAGITAHPTDVSVSVGKTATFRVTAAGSNLTYQWQEKAARGGNWRNCTLNGSTTATLSFTAPENYHRRQYRCVVTGADGVPVYSRAATLYAAKDIGLGETTANIAEGGDIVRLRFVPAISGSYTLKSIDSGDTYGELYDAFGKKLASNDEGGEGSNFSITHNLSAGAAYNYDVRYYDSYLAGTISLVLDADFHDAEITAQPVNQIVAPNQTATFRVTATGSNLRYQWQEMLPGSDTWQNTSLSGNKTATLRFKALESHDGRQFRCVVTGADGIPVRSDTVVLYVSSDTTRYRALLISEVNFDPVCIRNKGDVQMMDTMLQNVRGPGGGRYAVTTRQDLSPAQIQSEISAVFGGATAQDVSLFFIATHGDVSAGPDSTDAGALETVSGGYVRFVDLASWLNAVPGKVIVIVESCGSGAAIYANGLMAAGPAVTDEQFAQALIDAFASLDGGTALRPNTGELRVDNKFYVLTAAAFQQLSWGIESGPYNYFTKWLTEGVGTSGNIPADVQYVGNRDGVVTLEELYGYISAVGDGHQFGKDPDTGEPLYQTVKRYPENSNYQLFKR